MGFLFQINPCDQDARSQTMPWLICSLPVMEGVRMLARESVHAGDGDI